jgi:cytochrome c5
VGLKVDSEAVPPRLLRTADLDDPAVTAELLRRNAVVGVRGFFRPDGTLRSVGITCALCHSTVDDSFAPGIGKRLDGWANRDLNVGAIVNLAPDAGLQPIADMLHADVPTVRTVLQAWGPGKYDATVFFDGKAFRPDGATGAVLIPNAYGLAGSNLATWTGWGSVTHWNALVSNLEMHGAPGTFYDPRLNNAEQFPIAAEQGFGNVRPPEGTEDRISGKLAALHVYQLAIPAPDAPAGSFDAAAAARGEAVFAGEAGCATCHVPPLYTEPGYNAHKPEEIGIDSFQADRSPAHVYRTTPLPGAWRGEGAGGYYHDGRFATLMDVVNHYDQFRHLGLTEDEKRDLVEFLKSI